MSAAIAIAQTVVSSSGVRSSVQSGEIPRMADAAIPKENVSSGLSPLHNSPMPPPSVDGSRSTTMASPRSVHLSMRQVEVIALVRAGLANKEIAEKLEVSIQTVKNHLRAAFTKMGIVSRNDLLRESTENIEKLRGRVRELNKAIEPFACYGKLVMSVVPDTCPMTANMSILHDKMNNSINLFTVGDCRTAHSVFLEHECL